MFFFFNFGYFHIYIYINIYSNYSASEAKYNTEIECHDTGNVWTFVSIFAWKNSINAVTRGVGMPLSSCALKSVNSIERIQLKMCASFNGNPYTTIIFCYSPTNASDERDNIHFLQWPNFPCLIHFQTQQSDYPLIYQRSMYKKSWGNTTVCKFLQGIWFHTKKEDGANTTSIWSLQKSCYSYNSAL